MRINYYRVFQENNFLVILDFSNIRLKRRSLDQYCNNVRRLTD